MLVAHHSGASVRTQIDIDSKTDFTDIKTGSKDLVFALIIIKLSGIIWPCLLLKNLLEMPFI